MAEHLKGITVAILAADGAERIKLEQPRGALYGAGSRSELLSIRAGEIQARQFPVDHLVTDVPAERHALLPLRINSGADLPALCPATVAQFAKVSVPGCAPGGMR